MEGGVRLPLLYRMEKPKDLSAQLVQAFIEHPPGLCGQHDPARVIGDVVDLEQRLQILTLGVVLDISQLSEDRWSTLVGVAGNWLLDPSQVAYHSSQEVQTAMQEIRIQSPQHIPRVWWQVCRGVQGRFKGLWNDLLAMNRNNALAIQEYLRQNKATFPVLAGPVISARWLDLVHRVGGVSLQNWENLTVSLTARQKRIARQLGIDTDGVHPQLSSGLHIWTTACQGYPDDSCGFAACPKKSNF